MEEYDRTADKPWTRLTQQDKVASLIEESKELDSRTPGLHDSWSPEVMESRSSEAPLFLKRDRRTRHSLSLTMAQL